MAKKKQNLDLTHLLPSSLKNETLTSLTENLFNRFLAEERSVQLDGRIGKLVDNNEPVIQAPDLSRELNALVPSIYYKNGSEENVFSFDDMISRLDQLNVDVVNARSWMAEKTFNFHPPISYDAFVNYSNYYWIAKSLQLPFEVNNPNLDPEYYVISRPAPNSLVKMPVTCATTRNINLTGTDRNDEEFEVTFVSSTQFNVTRKDLKTSAILNVIVNDALNNLGPSGGVLTSTVAGEQTSVVLYAPDSNFASSSGPDDSDALPDSLISFKIENGLQPFSAGDKFIITAKYRTANSLFLFSSASPINKGTILSLTSTAQLMTIDGLNIVPGMRILVKDQDNAVENGIYTVLETQWVRSFDSKYESHLRNNAKVWVTFGAVNGQKTFTINKAIDDVNDVPIYQDIFFTDLNEPGDSEINVNAWQRINFWYHRDDIAALEQQGIKLDNITQATRPIIQYDEHLTLSKYVQDGYPSDSGIFIDQEKVKKNQAPLFDLYYYDGTHAKKASSIFFYAVDPDFEIDAELGVRTKVTADYDYIFSIGIEDEDGRLLFYKHQGALNTIWVPGVDGPTILSLKFNGETVGASLAFNSISQTADNQEWKLTAISETEFEVVGDRSGLVGVAETGMPFECDDFELAIDAAPYAVGESFSFNIINKLSPRYVKKLENGTVINYPGGPAGDAQDAAIDGTWLTPLRMFQNLERETRDEISYGDAINHFRSVIRNQNGFDGVSFGNNNSRNLDFNPGLGGKVREFGSNFPLLAGLLIQKDLSPITIIDFAEQQYNVALASIDQFIVNDLANYAASVATVAVSGINPSDPLIQKLLKYYEQQRSENEILKATFSDSTAKVANWPTTLPMFGMVPAVQPNVVFDQELGIDVIVHHDGHISPVAPTDFDLNRTLVRTVVKRSDGTSSAGIFSETPPPNPYARQLWFRPSTGQIFIFDVIDDTDTPPVGQTGDFWYRRSDNTLWYWDAVTPFVVWNPSLDPIESRWIEFSPENIRNSLLVAVEDKLYDSVHPSQTVHPQLQAATSSDQYNEIELARFASKYGYDTFAPDYVAGDAFTWNYSQAVIPSVAAGTARWHDIYKQYFDIPGFSLSTTRPNVEPWRLLNFTDKPAWWDAQYDSTVEGTSNIAVPARVISTANINTLVGLQTIDGVTVSAGDRVLLVGQTVPQFNGIYIASVGGWSRSSDVLVNGLTIGVTDGANYSSTVWTITTSDPIVINSTQIVIEQVRVWKQQMWDDIKAALPPGTKLCVNPFNDSLLPPYVSPSLAYSSEALLTVIPPGASDGYQFGDNGPVEIIWKKSLEYWYGMARTAFRLNPLEFVDTFWGETYITANPGDVRLERNLMALYPHTEFLYHGEKLKLINERTFGQHVSGTITAAGVATVKMKVTHIENDVTIFYIYVNDNLVYSAYEGQQFSFGPVDGVEFVDVVIDDLGIPFNIDEELNIQFYDDIITYAEDLDGCVGCYVDNEGMIVLVEPVAPTYSHKPATMKKLLGIGQWFTNLLRFNFIDSEISEATLAYRGWELKLVHRIGALIRQDTLSVLTNQGKLPPTAYSVLLKKSEKTKDFWITGLRIQLTSIGEGRTNQFGFLVPKTDGSDWSFRIETYNPQNPTVEYYQFDTSGDYQTFFALNKQSTDLEWRHYTTKTSIETAILPLNITGVQNVLNFVFGYIDRLYDLGFRVFPEGNVVIDDETGRNLDWQLDVEKFVDRVFRGMSTGQGHILNPVMKNLVLETPYGLMSKYTDKTFIDAYSAQAVYDVTGTIISIDNLNVIRTDDRTITYSETPLFSGHLFIDEYEHAIVMNKRFSDSRGAATIFDPFLGSAIDTAYLSYVRQEEINGKPAFKGFFLSGNEVKRNMSSLVDSLATSYDAARTYNNYEMSEHALALLGYTKKSYFGDINITDSAQFNFWRGLIQAKGTNMSIDAFVNYRKFLDASTDEYWAYKIAEYGDARERSFPELKIGTRDCVQKFTQLQFYNEGNDKLPLFTVIENDDPERWFTLDDLGTQLAFEAQYVEEEVIADQTFTYPAYIRLKNIFHNGDDSSPIVEGGPANTINGSILKVFGAGKYTVKGFTWLNPTKFSPIKLFDYVNDVLVREIGLWHPAIGIHSSEALESVNVIQSRDPANYNYSTKVVNNANYHVLKPWASREVGRVWWDTSNLGYIPYYDAAIFANRDTRHSRWGRLADWATLDLYEWVESSVHPSEYDSYAAAQEGSAEIPSQLKASGKVAFKRYYERSRRIFLKPIAWSQAGTGNENAHPSFGPAEFTTVYASGDYLIADKGRTAAIGLAPDRRFGAWDRVNQKPVGEVKLLDTSRIMYYIGSEESIDAPILTPAIILSGSISSMSVTALENKFGVPFLPFVGRVRLSRRILGNDVIHLRMSNDDGVFQELDVPDWESNNLTTNSTLFFDFTTFGLRLAVVRETQGFISKDDLSIAITGNENNIYVREGIRFETILGLPTNFNGDATFINDDTDPNYWNTEYEWRAWDVPTQSDLDDDLLPPHNRWLPYVGDEIEVGASSAVMQIIDSPEASLTLKSGLSVSRYRSEWTDWDEITSQKIEKISDGLTLVQFELEDIDPNRVSIYADGSQVNPQSYTIGSDAVTMSTLIPEGTTVLLLYRAYQPSSEELSFNPDVEDDIKIQKHYKLDYQYTTIDVRDEDGNITGQKYYFWVQDKNIPSPNKNMSLAQAKKELRDGPDVYTIFSRCLKESNTSASFDSCSIAGLKRYVKSNDTFKLRFLRHFTLRDDPEEINLKNVHTEWTLIRRTQRKKIPKKLWDLLTDSVSGVDVGGNPVPSQARIDYDERYGTQTRFGFKSGQVLADSELLKTTITNTILNTSLVVKLKDKSIPDYITALDFDESDEWFSTPENSRNTMALIWNTARPTQVNEIFFDALEDALASNFELTDIFKTSFITVNSTTIIQPATTLEQMDEFF